MIPPVPVRDVGYAAESLALRVGDLDTALRYACAIVEGTSSWMTDGPERIVLNGRIRMLVADIARMRSALESVVETIHPAEEFRSHSLTGAATLLAPYVMSGLFGVVPGALSGKLWAKSRPLMTAILASLPAESPRGDGAMVTGHAAHSTAAPTGLASRVARIPSDDVHIRIERYSDDGGNRFEVYLSGTNFGGGDMDPWNFASNLELAVTGSSPSVEAVRIAMESAGITRNTPVVLTGHSQGGLIALALANSGDYDVDAVVTVGTPVGVVPDSTTVPTIHVVHPEDPVPAVGGLIDPDSSTWVVHVANGEYLIGAHNKVSYLPSVGALDELHDPRIDELMTRIQPRGVGVSRDFVAVTSPESRYRGTDGE